MDVQQTIQLLDQTLSQMGAERDIFVCGGAALILLQVSSRVTMDVDVLLPNQAKNYSSLIHVERLKSFVKKLSSENTC